MGWKGTVRSIGAAMRAAERDAQRRERQRQRDYREMVRRAELMDAADAVAAYEDYVEALTSVHRDTSTEYFDWEGIRETPDPAPPLRSSRREDEALRAMNAYEPSLLDKLLKRTEQRRRELEDAVVRAHAEDEAAYQAARRGYESLLASAQADRALAERVLAGDVEAFEDVVRRFGSALRSIGDLGSRVSLSIERDERSAAEAAAVRVLAEIHVHGKDVIPKQSRTLLKSGKLSVKDLPPSQFHAIHQDYVCGCVLRVANELLALLPVRGVWVTAVDEMLNPATGHIEQQPIVAIYAPRETMERLNLGTADASEAMANFVHRMSFKKTTGFQPVQPLDPSILPGV